MTTAPTRMPKLPWPGQKVCWRNPQQARGYGWEDVFGTGPFDVVRLVDHCKDGLTTGLVLRTKLGEWEVDEIWLAMTDDEESDIPDSKIQHPASPYMRPRPSAP